jgi:flagellar hook protein FlgE
MSGFDFYKAFNGAGNQMADINLMFSNLMNFTTPGYKAQNTDFQEIMSQGMGLGAFDQTNSTTFTQGTVRKTGSALDLAIQDGQTGSPCSTFFVLSDGSRIRYTRAGHFMFKDGKLTDPFSGLHVQGYVLDSKGNKKSDKLQDISLPYDPKTKLYGGMFTGFKFGDGGKLYGEVRISDPLTKETVEKTVPLFQVALANFPDPSALKQDGATTFEATSAAGVPSYGTAGEGAIAASVQAHSLEMSNVDIATMSQEIIMARLSYDAQFAAFKAMNQMTTDATNLVK